ncbi:MULTISPECIES: DUF6365 family protein [Streptomyces]|uniref:Glycosyltransferase family 4 protein n=1 Tax=Streptomyces parvus TaxID=66428 RepID=A0A5D4JLF8_9ACTN|nr:MULTISPECIES: DUF6365 family protein [Streptomyces]PVC95890.1 hypothetical protein DBP12_17205 [Streptomyces sp. CS014]TYR64453.1 hypothetical protein FY004_11380 [Streptomyces parvus]
MKLLFVAPVVGTHGEVTTGLDLAGQLAPAGIAAHFVVDTHNAPQIQAAGVPGTVIDTAMGAGVRKVIEDVVRVERPDVIVLSDYLSYWLMMHRVYRTDPWFVERLNVPVIPLDLYEWENTDFRIDHFGLDLEVDRRILGMRVQLRPAPWARPDPGPGSRALTYPFMRPLPRPTDEVRRAVRSSLGLREGDRLLSLSVSGWQRYAQTVENPVTRGLARQVPERVAAMLRRLSSTTRFLVVGPDLEGLEGLPAERTHRVPACAPDRYQELLDASDAVLSLHVPASALVRSVFSDLPAVHIVHSGPDTGAAHAEAPGGLEPYSMWPLRWNSVVRPLLSDNPLAAAFRRAELLDTEGTVETLDAVLNDPRTRAGLSEARGRYLAALDALPPVPEIFAEAVHRAS